MNNVFTTKITDMQTTTIKGIQMIGTQRSGSNLLRVMLDQSPEMASPHPPHLLVTFVPLLPRYGLLLQAANYKTLLSDVVDYVNANPVPWEGVVLDKAALFTQSRVHSLYEINRLVYEQAALAKQAGMWCCKSMNNMYYVDALEQHGSIDQYIYLYRDGRDVAASFKKAIVGEKHIYHIARQWQQDQAACLALRAQLPESRCISLSYEQLTSSPVAQVQTLCNFLGIAYGDHLLEYHTSSTSKNAAAAGAMWSNLEKPILQNNTGKFLQSFRDHDLEIFELVAGDALLALGYPLYTDRSNKALISEEAIARYEIENKALKQQSIRDAAANDLEKRAPQEALLQAIKGRRAITH